MPDYAIIFCQIVLINTLIQCFDASFGILFQAIGRIKENHIMGGSIYLLVLPVSYLFVKFGSSPEVVFYIQLIATIIVSFGIKLYLLIRIAGLKANDYFNRIILPVVRVTIFAVVVPFLIRINMTEGYVRFILALISSILSVSVSVYFFGIDKMTRKKITVFIMSGIKHKSIE